MATDNLLGEAVRIRRGRHGGRVGKVVVFERRASLASLYHVIEVELKAAVKLCRYTELMNWNTSKTSKACSNSMRIISFETSF